ncbi:1-acyl-sn-glycerol-3-phosphate acyltransferase alpha-like [Podarcis lilfordi]|uniref:1-acyl-sn-glycerol-3-phosphate acyltransferase n=1 Tax=Podarcis lilfordi TaxID=74358 RepID=A0AA35L6S3_9SAUR|nr:1-acyl-sn-glycerol-3-phosphate acyltransferase alpha-like [Podarcis lilfordi]
MELFEWTLFLLIVLLIGVLFFSQRSDVYCKMVLFYGWIVVMIILVPPWVALIRGSRVENLKILCFVMRQVRYLLGVKITVQGSENLNTKGPYMVVANHQTILDILGIAEVLPDRCVILSKKELKYMGPMGIVCWLCKFILLDRNNKSSARDTMDHITRTLLQQNLRVWVYPEGTRNRTATLHPFKRGVFSVAVKAQIPIIPVVTSYYQQPPNLKDGQRPFFCRDKWIIQILPKIETRGFGPEDVPALADSTRKLMLDTFNEINGHIVLEKDTRE